MRQSWFPIAISAAMDARLFAESFIFGIPGLIWLFEAMQSGDAMQIDEAFTLSPPAGAWQDEDLDLEASHGQIFASSVPGRRGGGWAIRAAMDAGPSELRSPGGEVRGMGRPAVPHAGGRCGGWAALQSPMLAALPSRMQAQQPDAPRVLWRAL